MFVDEILNTATYLAHAYGERRRVALIHDMTEKRQAEEVIRHQANFDALTDLPNRRLFFDQLEQEIERSRGTQDVLALLFIDLDRFKEVNDTLGHDQGDQLLLEAARRIAASVRASDIVARLAGDEFTVILPAVGDAGIAEDIAEAILERIAAPYARRCLPPRRRAAIAGRSSPRRRCRRRGSACASRRTCARRWRQGSSRCTTSPLSICARARSARPRP